MQINAKQLNQQLQTELKPVYLVCGDDTLLMQEARLAIRHQAKQAGFHELELLTVNSDFNWDNFKQIAQNFNLFSDKTIIDLQNPDGKFDKAASQTLLEFCEQLPADKLLMISSKKLTSAQQKTHWFKHILKIGCVVTLWPINAHELPQWLQHRAKAIHISLDTNASQLLAELTVGNLLAANQAIEKLRLRFGEGATIQGNDITGVISDNARFNVFNLTHALLSGNSKQSLRILQTLHAEGTETTLILWAITRELRALTQYSQAVETGCSIQQVTQKEWQSRRPLIQAALKRLSYSQCLALLIQAKQVDETIKGIKIGNPWDTLEQLIMNFSAVEHGRV